MESQILEELKPYYIELTKRQDLKSIHSYYIDMTKFADAKAGASILIFGSILGTLLASGKIRLGVDFITGEIGVAAAAAFLAFLGIIASIGLLIWAIIPRSVHPKSRGTRSVIYWSHVAQRASAQHYLDELFDPNADSILQWGEQAFALSRVVSMKFLLIRLGIIIGTVGAIFTVLLFAVTAK